MSKRSFLSSPHLLFGIVLLAFGLSLPAAPKTGKLSVAVTEPDIEAIVKVVGGDQISSFSLFHECILNKDLLVEPDALDKLVTADVVVWSGFFNESAAISRSLELLDPARKKQMNTPEWVDVSKGVRRVQIRSINSCSGFKEESFMFGNPFFWLDPTNARLIARDTALGLAKIRPVKRAYFLANAKAFSDQINRDIDRWRKELAPLKGLKVFSTQCGWRYFASMGAPSFVVCKENPGKLPLPDLLADHINKMKVKVVMVDPNTPPNYAKIFKIKTKARLIIVPSSIYGIPGAETYQALFDNMIKALKKASGR